MHGVPVVSLVEMATRPVHVHVEISASPWNPEAVILCHAQVISVLKNVFFNKILCFVICHTEGLFFLQMIGTVWLMSFHLRWKMVQNHLALVSALKLSVFNSINHEL